MAGTNGDQNGVLKWWKIAALTKLELLLEITGEVMMPRELNRGRKRSVGLHKNFPWGLTSPGASSHLCEKLKRPFASAEIGQMQRQVRIDNSDQRHVRKMQTFRDHLRADENVDFARAEIAQRFAVRFFARH